MKLPEIWDLFERIVMYYPGFVADDAKAAAWHKLLSDVPLEAALANLERHARAERYAPTVADLRAGYGFSYDGPHIPDAEETRRMLAEMDEAAKRAVPPPAHIRERVMSIVRRRNA